MNGQGLQPDTFPGDGFRGGVIDLAGNGGDGNHALLWVIFTLLLIVLVVTLVSLFLDEYRRTQEAHADGHDGSPPTDEHEAPTQVVDLQPESPQAEAQAASAQADEQPASAGGDALSVLDTRYAAGEVTRRDYLRIRKDILGPEAAAS
jgi:uncharacterized membrane protein